MSPKQPIEALQTLATLGAPPLHIVLYSPQIPPNTGNVARLCAATGCALHLIEPINFSLDDRSLKRAGLDYWGELGVVIHPSLADFLATPLAERAWYFTTRATTSYAKIPYTHGDVLVFGSETSGLPDEIHRTQRERSLRIPMRPNAVRSLNLATSVGIVAYAALQQIGVAELQ